MGKSSRCLFALVACLPAVLDAACFGYNISSRLIMKGSAHLKIIAAALAAFCTALPAGRLCAAPVPVRRITSMDLHTHSYCSDGNKTPETLIREAADMGLEYYSLTDHNTTSCLARARAGAKKLGIGFIPGIELTADDDSLHILGLGIDPQAPEIAALCKNNKAARETRMFAIIKKLPQGRPAGAAAIDLIADILLPSLNQERRADGREQLSLAQAAGMTTDRMLPQLRGQITLPDIAKVLIARKWAVDKRDAFNRFLNVPMEGPPFRRVIQAIHAAGGLAVWAHPGTVYKSRKPPWVFSGRRYRDFESLAEDLIRAGLDGIQLYTPGDEGAVDHKVAAFAAAYQKKSGRQLILTPGSDYHGGQDFGPKTMGGISVPENEFRKILSRLRLK